MFNSRFDVIFTRLFLGGGGEYTHIPPVATPDVSAEIWADICTDTDTDTLTDMHYPLILFYLNFISRLVRH